MYIVITDNKIAYAKKLQALNRQLQAKLEPEEFKTIGSDHIAKLTDTDLTFVQDKQRLSTILFGNFFRKDKTVFYLCCAVLILLLVLFVQVNSLSGALQQTQDAITQIADYVQQ